MLPSTRALARLLLCAVLASFGAVAFAAPASAHAIVERTAPGIDAVVDVSPDRVVMHFNEPIEVAFGAIRVYDTNGHRVDTGNVDYVPDDPTAAQVGLEAGLPDGTYTVTWRVISADSHVISEAFVFHVGEPGAKPQGIADELLAGQAGASPAVGSAFGVVRAAGFASLIVLVGALCFLFYVWHAAVESEPPPEFGTRWRRIVVIAWGVALVCSLLALPLQASQAAGLDLSGGFAPDSLAGVLGTRFGRLMAIRAAVLVVAAGLWAWLRGRESHRTGPGEAAAALIALALFGTTALAGHAGSTPPVWVNVPVDVLHLVAVAAWIGGLVVLVAAAFPAYGSTDDLDRLAPIVARFSDLAVVAVALVVVTGLWQSFVEVQALRALTTTYGWTLIAKVAVFLPLVGLGAVNNRRAKPRIEQAGAGDDRGRGLRLLKRLVAVEVLLATVVVAITAFLVNLPPARVSAGVDGPFITDVAFGDHELNVVVDPNRVGENEVHLTVSTSAGAAADVKEMRVLFTMPAESIGPLVGRGVKLVRGHYVVQGRQLSVPGRWTLEIIGRFSRFEEERVRVPITVNG